MHNTNAISLRFIPQSAYTLCTVELLLLLFFFLADKSVCENLHHNFKVHFYVYVNAWKEADCLCYWFVAEVVYLILTAPASLVSNWSECKTATRRTHKLSLFRSSLFLWTSLKVQYFIFPLRLYNYIQLCECYLLLKRNKTKTIFWAFGCTPTILGTGKKNKKARNKRIEHFTCVATNGISKCHFKSKRHHPFI